MTCSYDLYDMPEISIQEIEAPPTTALHFADNHCRLCRKLQKRYGERDRKGKMKIRSRSKMKIASRGEREARRGGAPPRGGVQLTV